jgi:hypothetical protein
VRNSNQITEEKNYKWKEKREERKAKGIIERVMKRE